MPPLALMSDSRLPRRPVRVRASTGLALAALAGLLVPLAALAAPDTYVLDPVHTRVLLAVDHAGFSQALGTVSGSTGTLLFDPDNWRSARLEAEVPLTRLDFGDEAWNTATRGRGLLDAERHPVARFRSTRVEPLGDDRARVVGLLTLRGVEREVVLEVVLNGLRRYPLPPFRRTVGFSATTTLSRAEFGSTAWASVIGDSVALRLEVEATRGGSADVLDDANGVPDGTGNGATPAAGGAADAAAAMAAHEAAAAAGAGDDAAAAAENAAEDAAKAAADAEAATDDDDPSATGPSPHERDP